MAFLGKQYPKQGQPSPYSASERKSQNCPHCGKDINEPPTKRDEANQKAIIENYLDTLGRIGSLTKWEEEFVQSVAEQFEKRGTLSPKQVSTLEKIYSEKC